MFHQIWSSNWLGRRKLILSIYINRLLYRIWYLNFRCPAAHLKLSAEDLNSGPRILITRMIWVWICRLVYRIIGRSSWNQISGSTTSAEQINGLISNMIHIRHERVQSVIRCAKRKVTNRINAFFIFKW